MTTYFDRGAVLSDCGLYRYTLRRRFGPGGTVSFVGLNPSTANAEQDDPTIRRCVGFAKSWGFGAIVMLNLFAWRATKPEDMMLAQDPVGPNNDAHLLLDGLFSDITVACWGAHGNHRNRDVEVRKLLGDNLHFLQLTKHGHPGHPLYLKANLSPKRWS